MSEEMNEQEDTALVPIDEALPELSAEQYVQVREWDAARMMLKGNYEAADGEYLRKIRDVLKGPDPKRRNGLWTRYLEARRIPERTAQQRIQAAEGRYVRSQGATVAPYLPNPAPLPAPAPEPSPTFEPAATWPTMPVGEPEPAPRTVAVDRQELERLRNIEEWAQDAGYSGENPDYGEWNDEEEEEEYDPPTPVWRPEPVITRDELPTTAAQWQQRIEEIAEETPEVQALPVTRLISSLHHLTDKNIDAWFSLASQYDIDALSSMLDRFSLRVTRHRQSPLRIVNSN